MSSIFIEKDMGMTKKEQQLARNIGAAISVRRKARNLTQIYLAEKLEVEPETISRIERGVTLAPISRISDIADVLNCPLADLLRDSSPRFDDRAQAVGASMKGLNEADTKLILELIEKFATRMRKK